MLVHIPDKDHVTTRYYGWYANRPRGMRQKADPATPSGLRAAQGLEVTAWGTRDDNSVMPTPQGTRCGFVVSRFAVRAAEGNAALPGLLR